MTWVSGEKMKWTLVLKAIAEFLTTDMQELANVMLVLEIMKATCILSINFWSLSDLSLTGQAFWNKLGLVI